MSFRWLRILMYHAVAHLAHDPNRLCISPQRFEAHMSHLKRRGLRGTTVRELRRATDEGNAKGLVGLTFDDGYENFLTEAVPLLERYGFTATVFVVSDKLGEMNEWDHMYEPRPPLRLMDAEGVREVSARQMEVGSHTVSHARLPGLEPDLLREEIAGSRETLGELLGERVEGFCYPYGGLDKAAIEAARQAGYSYACAWKTQLEWSEYDLPRIPVDQKDNLLRFEAKLRIYPQYARISRDRK
jgi:peptidoglycan/xylan/chitin deacetylase (PgdA/CDA1 family)